jgi:hypothetical protein
MRPSIVIAAAILASPLAAEAQNLLANPRFDTDISGWRFVSGWVNWSSDDAEGSTSSGSLRVAGSCPMSRIAQCLPATAVAYDLAFQARLHGWPGLTLSFYISEDCTGVTIPGLSFAPLSPPEWAAFSGRALRPAEARSMEVLASAQDPFCEPCFPGPCPPTDSWFDNFSLTEAPAATARFYTLDPCRILDTRAEGRAIEGLSDRAVATSGICGIPSTASALAANVTVTGATTAGDLRLFPSGTAPPDASSINYAAGQTRANNAIVLLDTSGVFTIHSDQPTGTVHLIIDVTGYFE